MTEQSQHPNKPGIDLPVSPGFFRRLAAQFYDIVLLIAILLVANGVLLLLTDTETLKTYTFLHRAYLISICFLFYAWFWTHGGQTLGLRAWNIKVLTLDQKPISWSQALLRFITAMLSWTVFFGLGFIWVLFNKEKLSWHDRLSKTALFSVPPKIKSKR